MIEDPRFTAIADLFVDDSRVSHGTMMASYGLKVGGKIFAMLVGGRLVVKLPKPRVDALVAAGLAERFDPGHGRPMKEWASLIGDEPDWAGLAREAIAFVGASPVGRGLG
ncbi:TfoX/Sxy family protein [Phreatobacter stygius]|uniref:TfoX/Sxy family protein n=2 Tax=Phreatobacter stygius TaxID=1940610 RepID=A0A4D7BF73_9HYPH|nr:TfoX/Sxy family protein [Phreatobacter stygius]